MDLKPDQWSLVEELSTALEGFATDFMTERGGEIHNNLCSTSTCVGAIEVHPDCCLQVSPGAGFPTHCYGAAATPMKEGDFCLRHGTKHSDPLHCPGPEVQKT
ncbi:hypothetical protein N1851_003839 [Merluccius polli]|uniref:Uncharacterized protein n=1 Tax=Merluccius polli TaxID=89951 RepID=A0AA47N9M8_MERPO|nr:hypothetical protein N1851_003839 [Merluccius polli]